jgi:hypothetical protein
MRELIIASVLGISALLTLNQNSSPVVDDNVEQSASAAFETCNCMIGGTCDCDPCLCDNCPCKDEVLVKESVVKQEFDSSGLELQIEGLKANIFSLQSDMSLMNLKVNRLENMPHLTEEEVKEIVRKEVKVQLELLNTKTNEKVTKTVSIQNTGSEIVLNPGEILTHIDGVPVRGNTQYMSGVSTMNYSTPSFQVSYPQAQPMVQRRATIVPRFSSRFSTCGPGGCN